MNNPYGADLYLGELIPPQYIGNGPSEFRPGTSEDDNNSDRLYFLSSSDTESDDAWDQYFYKSGYNDSVTVVASATAKAGTHTNNGIANIDVSIDGGTITNLESCDSNGNSVDHNVSDHTLITIDSTNAPLAGFKVKIKGVFGKKIK